MRPNEHVVILEQPANVRTDPRWGHGRPFHGPLSQLIGAADDDYAERLRFLERYGPDLARIPRHEREESEPCWDNGLFTGIDGASLYAFLRDRDSRRYFEIGSGWSTRFAHRARQDGGLRTEITAIDPTPRVAISALCDRAIAERLEDVDVTLFDELEAGDVVLIDGSHRVYMNNDVTAFWLDVLPRIAPGVLIGVHDVLLPEDYPSKYHGWYWSEQYLLGVALMAGGGRIRPVLPCHYVCVEPALRQRFVELWDANGLAGINGYGSAFWFEHDLGELWRTPL